MDHYLSSATEGLDPGVRELFERLRQTPADLDLHRRCSRKIVEGSLPWSQEDAHSPELYEVLRILFGGDAVHHQALANLVCAELKKKYRLVSGVPSEDLEQVCQRIARDDLIVAALSKTILCDLEVQGFLGRLRRHLLLRFRDQGVQGLMVLVVALAEQFLNTEHLLVEDPDEHDLVESMIRECDPAAFSEQPSGWEEFLLVLAMYVAPHHLPSADAIGTMPAHEFSPRVRHAVKRMIHDPIREKELAASIPSFGGIACRMSREVRRQYEENPYPRWFSLDADARPLEEEARELGAACSWPEPQEGLEILVPGCGTGFHPLTLAVGNPGSRILAIDLSRASMAYGLRVAHEQHIDNVEFLHGDLLDLPRLGRTFHHIDCTGVLHHLRDPKEGWRALVDVLRPGGTMRLGVYGKLARMPVSALRQHIRELGVTPDREAIREFRKQLLTSERHRGLLTGLAACSDFYSTSSLRDLLFHTHEVQFELAEIERTLAELGLEFLGFRLNRAMKTKYLEAFPDDPHLRSLANWRRFQVHYTGSLNLFRFWVRKPGARQVG